MPTRKKKKKSERGTDVSRERKGAVSGKKTWQ